MRPARLPIPPSRPGAPSVAGRRARAGLAGLLALASIACTAEEPPPSSTEAEITIAYLFDGSPPDAELVTGPPLAGLELAARQAGDVEIEPVNVGLEPAEALASLRALGEDPGVVAAVVAPWTGPPAGAIALLAEDRVPVVTLSWAWGPPPATAGEGLWLSFAVGRAAEAVLLLSGAASASPGDAAICLAGDDHPTSRTLLATTEELGRAVGAPEVVAAGVVTDEADAVAARIEDAGCAMLVWTGGADAATSLLREVPDPPATVATSRIKTEDGIELAASGPEVLTVCACADVSLSTDPTHQRFVHDLQAESGAPPGPFGVEAYDAGRLLIGLVDAEGDVREELAAALGGLERFRGLETVYAFEPDGSRAPGKEAGRWRAAGSRWMPAEPPTAPLA
ncbi:MAG: ABC transporter substrate-binding protein [Actinomycetota bacterium]